MFALNSMAVPTIDCVSAARYAGSKGGLSGELSPRECFENLFSVTGIADTENKLRDPS